MSTSSVTLETKFWIPGGGGGVKNLFCRSFLSLVIAFDRTELRLNTTTAIKGHLHTKRKKLLNYRRICSNFATGCIMDSMIFDDNARRTSPKTNRNCTRAAQAYNRSSLTELHAWQAGIGYVI